MDTGRWLLENRDHPPTGTTRARQVRQRGWESDILEYESGEHQVDRGTWQRCGLHIGHVKFQSWNTPTITR